MNTPVPPTNENYGTVPDHTVKRLLIGIAVSILANVLLWAGAAQAVRYRHAHDLRIVEMSRVVMDKQGHIKPKLVKIVKPEIKPQIKPQIQPVPAPVTPQTKLQPIVKATPPPPPGAHSHVMTAPPGAPSLPGDDTPPPVLPGGNQTLGTPTAQQNPGNATENPAHYVPPMAPATPLRPAFTPTRMPQPGRPRPILPALVTPVTPPAPEVKGPTREAEVVDIEAPNIDDLTNQDIKPFVHAKLTIAVDGSVHANSVQLLTSSGNQEVDRRLIAALKKSKWKPALKDGIAIEKTKYFRFDIVIK